MDIDRRSELWLKAEAVVLPKIITDLLVSPVSFNKNWKHLKGLNLADPDYEIPGYIDILLGVDIFNQVVCQGWRTGLPGSLMALNTRLSGTMKHNGPQQQVTSCFSSIRGDEILQRF